MIYMRLPVCAPYLQIKKVFSSAFLLYGPREANGWHFMPSCGIILMHSLEIVAHEGHLKEIVRLLSSVSFSLLSYLSLQFLSLYSLISLICLIHFILLSLTLISLTLFSHLSLQSLSLYSLISLLSPISFTLFSYLSFTLFSYLSFTLFSYLSLQSLSLYSLISFSLSNLFRLFTVSYVLTFLSLLLFFQTSVHSNFPSIYICVYIDCKLEIIAFDIFVSFLVI